MRTSIKMKIKDQGDDSSNDDDDNYNVDKNDDSKTFVSMRTPIPGNWVLILKFLQVQHNTCMFLISKCFSSARGRRWRSWFRSALQAERSLV